jgi:predicted class III extradiol MEMO1 family dioxygenase
VRRCLGKLEEISTEDAEILRRIEEERLDLWLQKLEKKIELGGEKAIEIALRIQERRAKLRGLDAPKRLDIEARAAIRQYVGVDVEDV